MAHLAYRNCFFKGIFIYKYSFYKGKTDTKKTFKTISSIRNQLTIPTVFVYLDSLSRKQKEMGKIVVKGN